MHIDSPFVLWFVSINIGINAEVENYCILWSHVPLFMILKSKNWRINLCFIQSRYLCIWTELILISLTSKSVCRPGVVSEKSENKTLFYYCKKFKIEIFITIRKTIKVKRTFFVYFTFNFSGKSFHCILFSLENAIGNTILNSCLHKKE